MRADTDRRVVALLDLIARYGVECHAIGWHRARYEDTVPPELRQARDGVLALIEARLRELLADAEALAERERETLARLERSGD